MSEVANMQKITCETELKNALNALLRYVRRCREQGYLTNPDEGPVDFAAHVLERCTEKSNQLSLRDLLAQAAAYAIKCAREKRYIGPWQVADDILNETPEVLQHRENILGIRASVEAFLDFPFSEKND